MVKKKIYKSLFAIILTLAVLLTSVSSIFVLAEGTVTFNLTPRITKTYSVAAGDVTMPEHISTQRIICYSSWYNNSKTRVAGWTNDKTGDFYAAGTTVNLLGGTTLSPVFYDDSYTFNSDTGLTAGMKIKQSAVGDVNDYQKLNLSSDCASIVKLADLENNVTDNCIQFDSSTTNTDTTVLFTPAYKSTTIKDENGGTTGDYFFTGYNLGAKYKVTLKYRRTDNVNFESKIKVAFGTGAQRSHNGVWAAATKAIKKVAITTTKNSMTEFEEVTAIVTAPDTYVFSGESNEYRSGAVGIAVDLPKETAGVQIQIDDFKIERVESDYYATFSYGAAAGVDASFENDGYGFTKEGNITLPTNETAMNLYWQNGGKTYAAGATVNVADLEPDSNGFYPFTAFFGDVDLDFDEIDTEPFSFNENGSGLIESSTGFFTQLSKDNYWRIPAGYANDGKNTAFGAKGFSIKKNSEKGGNSLYLGSWKGSQSGSAYKNAVFFTHTPFDETDPNSHNSNASGKVNYSYVYFTPGQEYTLMFDYKIDKTGGNGNPPFNATIAFGMGTENGNCTYNTIQYSDDTTLRDGITLKEDSTSWEKAVITLKAPDSYTGNGITSARMGISLDVHTGGGICIDNVKLKAGGTRVDFKYDNVAGASTAFGGDIVAFADDTGILTLPTNENAKNLLWKHGDDLYEQGAEININDFGKDLTFTAFFNGVYEDYENISTTKFDLAGGNEKGKTLYEELSRNPSYWKVPKGLSNTQQSATKENYGTALGSDRIGINSGWGKSGNGLRFKVKKTGYTPTYYQAALFAHTPTSFGINDNITYSYVYFNAGQEYTMEFDYKTTSTVDVAIAFGINNSYYEYSKSATESLNSAGYATEGNHITLPNTNGTWAHATITATAPASYTANGTTSARVGLAIKDNTASDSAAERYDYFDNICFYPTNMTCHTAQFNRGTDTDPKDVQTVSFFKAKSPLKVSSSLTTPKADTIVGTRRTGVNGSGVAWQETFGRAANVVGWKLNESGKVYSPEDSVSVSDLSDNPVFSAVYSDSTTDFENFSEGFALYTSQKMSYSSAKAAIKDESGNKFVRFTGTSGMTANTKHQIILTPEANKIYGYNPNTKYKLTFKYRRTDNTDNTAKISFTFGAVAYDWYAESRAISSSEVCVAKKNMSNFETVSVVVNSPATQVFVNSNEYYYTSAMAIGVELSEGVVVDFDDIKLEEVKPEETFDTATFDYGDSEKVGDILTKQFTDYIIMPGFEAKRAITRKGVNGEGKAWVANYGKVYNQSGWYCTSNKKYYDFGDKVDAKDIGKEPKFVAVYENASIDFNNLADGFAFNGSNLAYSSSAATLKGTGNKYVNITGDSSASNTKIQVILFTEAEHLVGYSTNKTYKVTFKYRRNDTTSAASQIFFSFGAVGYNWRASSNAVSKVAVCDTKKGMSNFEEVTAYVTAPNTYEYNSGGSNPEYFYSRTMAIGASFSTGVSIDFDDINVEAIGRDEVAMSYVISKQNIQKVVIGKVGEKLEAPDMGLDRNTIVEGWYTDEALTTPFTLTSYPEEGMMVYGKTGDSAVRYYGFTDYPWGFEDTGNGKHARDENHIIEEGVSSDGDGYALKIDNTFEGADAEQQGVSIPVNIKPNTKYMISYDFMYEKIGDASSSYSDVWFNTTVKGRVWEGHKEHITTTDHYTAASIEEGKWYTGYVYGTTTEYTWSNYLAIFNRVPIGSVRYIDNIVITEVPSDSSVALFNFDSFQSPEPIIAKTNSTITLPAGNIPSNFVFLNWVLNNDDYTAKTYKLEADTVFNARTTIRTFTDSFENAYYGANGLNSYGLDLDWEIYDSQGKSSSNVKSGRYSLHKIGKDLRFSSYCIHYNAATTKYMMAFGKVYTASMWVKIENPVHKLGSIDLASCISLANSWDFNADEFHTVAIADIADGQWHEIKYTFTASAEYLSIIVPGNLSIYIDDVTVTYAEGAALSKDCAYDEYVPAFLSEDGTYVKPVTEKEGLDPFELVMRPAGADDYEDEDDAEIEDTTENTKKTKKSSKTQETADNSMLIYILIAAGALVLIGAATCIVLVIKKKNRR